MTSRDLDDRIFGVDGLLDYRAVLHTQQGRDSLGIEFLAGAGHDRLEREVAQAAMRVPAVAAAVEFGALALGPMRRVDAFSPSHTVKRTITDQRGSMP